MVPSILLLPSELKCLIAKLSSESPNGPNSLAALARTHTAYQREAEKALYETLCIHTSSDDSLKCMETLAKNSEKAGLVRFLTIEYAPYNTHKNRRATTYMLKGLINMRSLSDFRVRSYPGGVEAQSIMGLGKILCQSHSRLRTFYCLELLNISRIIKSQTELQILGLYRRAGGSPRNILKTLNELHNAQLFLPIVFTLEHGHFRTIPTYIRIFPAFYSVDRLPSIPQILAESFRKDQGKCMLAKVDMVFEISIYLIDTSDMPSIYALAKGLAVSFHRIGWLNLWFERRCEIPPQKIQEDFSSFFSDLREVKIYVWPTE